MYVFIYYTNNTRFCLGFYDFENQLWIDGDGMVINNDFLWCYLPVKQMKTFLDNIGGGNMRTRKFVIDGEEYNMFNLEVMGNRINVASYALHEKINELISRNRYEEVRHIDGLYGYYVPSGVDESDPKSIRESIENAYVA